MKEQEVPFKFETVISVIYEFQTRTPNMEPIEAVQDFTLDLANYNFILYFM